MKPFFLLCGAPHNRKGAASLMALVRDGGLDPFSGALFVFRSKRADRIRIVWWDGTGICLYAKILEENGFCWPAQSATRIRLDHAQLMALLAGMDWKRIRPAQVRRPLSTG
ncbi:IS66 family insertion sequence element accessory protein TnpB (plasmid) [Rhizobium sp. T1470]|uniref:IS66 family insertion sequence element accessory protein TnpB n=1 Tax=unclassified Rhizobium TaxID=2613769 RepID=UPI00296E7905|nr:IS66 family insertion sequence element accessory protein TnpB [Rhizobium sp. T1473]